MKFGNFKRRRYAAKIPARKQEQGKELIRTVYVVLSKEAGSEWT